MKDRIKRQLQQFVTRRSYQIMVGSAAALAVASATGALLTRPADDTARPDAAAAVAELGRSGGEGAGSRSWDRTVPGSPSTSASSSTGAPTGGPSSKAPSEPARAAETAAAESDAPATPPPPPSAKTLDYGYQTQINGWYCGPAALRIALTALDVTRGQDDLAGRLGTTMSGTNSADDITRVANALAGEEVYRSRFIPGNAASPAQMDRLQADVVRAVVGGRAVVANIAGSATGVNGAVHSYPGGHYLTVVGYRDNGRTVRIADPANPSVSSYWMSTINLAHWIATRGYTA